MGTIKRYLIFSGFLFPISISISLWLFIANMLVGWDDKNFMPIYEFGFYSLVISAPFYIVSLLFNLIVKKKVQALSLSMLFGIVLFYFLSKDNQPIKYTESDIEALAVKVLEVDSGCFSKIQYWRAESPVEHAYKGWTDSLAITIESEECIKKIMSGESVVLVGPRKYNRYRLSPITPVDGYRYVSGDFACTDPECSSLRTNIHLSFKQYYKNYL